MSDWIDLDESLDPRRRDQSQRNRLAIQFLLQDIRHRGLRPDTWLAAKRAVEQADAILQKLEK